MKQPLVTLVITNYNYGAYIDGCIQSAINQSYKNIRILVIDDGSIDNSLDTIKPYVKLGLVEIITRENKGIIYTRNQAISVATGEYLCFLDADDYFDSDYIENMVRIAESSGADVVYPDWHVFGDREYTESFEEFSVQALIEQRIHCTSESLIRIKSIKGHRFESEEVAEDWDFFLGLALDGKKFVHAGGCYINYRVRANTRSSRHSYWDDIISFVSILEKWQKKYPEKVRPMDLLLYAAKSRAEHIERLEQLINEKDTAITHYKKLVEDHMKVRSELESKLLRAGSIRAKIRTFVAHLYHGTRRRIAVPILNRLLRTRKLLKDYRIDHIYKKELQKISNSRVEDGRFAVVVHLFYIDNWPLFLRKIRLLPRSRFDLYVTLPEKNKSFIRSIQNDFPGAIAIVSPNRGRDVLPFMKVMSAISEKGYLSILKFHSKKSTHRDDGQDWLESMMDQIVPDDMGVVERIVDTTTDSSVGVLGPRDVYYPLTINYPANRRHLESVLTSLYSEKDAFDILSRRREYGFFGGTMFWVDGAAINRLVQYSAARHFEEESGQIDGTFAHALERLFCLVPEIEGYKIFDTDGISVEERDYQSDNIPDWSEDHEK